MDSTTTSAPTSFHLSSAGSFTCVSRILLAVDDQRIAVDADLALEAAVDGVVRSM